MARSNNTPKFTLTKGIRAKKAREKLGKLKHRRETRWRFDDTFESFDIGGLYIACAWGAFTTVVLWGVSLLLYGLVGDWHLLWQIPGGITAVAVSLPILLGIERGVQNLYEWGSISICEKRVQKLREDEIVFDTLLERWNTAIRQAGGNPKHEAFKPEKHEGVFAQMLLLEERLPGSPVNLQVEIHKCMSEFLRKELTPIVERIGREQESAARLQEFAAQQKAQQDELYNEHTRALLRTFRKDESELGGENG